MSVSEKMSVGLSSSRKRRAMSSEEDAAGVRAGSRGVSADDEESERESERE
ncbi:hypothetical protein FACS189472_12020 [Alphaproteobacteria bacterium]|nr:hypothetical protein FACS189472_12020 [Alphaproteobacteria bacterium]